LSIDRFLAREHAAQEEKLQNKMVTVRSISTTGDGGLFRQYTEV
jgi:hypothetical protein